MGDFYLEVIIVDSSTLPGLAPTDLIDQMRSLLNHHSSGKNMETACVFFQREYIVGSLATRSLE